jgi:hypothetical protein
LVTSTVLNKPAVADVELTPADRCDRCGARAYVRVQLGAGELFFCGHHSREHAPAYLSVATSVVDETDKVLAGAAA